MSNPNQLPPGAFEQRVLSESSKATYSYAVTGVAPAAAATAVLVLNQPASAKILSLSRVSVSGVATAVAEVDVILAKVTIAANLVGGTATQPSFVTHDSADPTPTGVINLYSANPSTFTSVPLRARHLQVAAVGTQTAPIDEVVWTFGGAAAKLPKIRAAGEAYAISLNGGTVPSGLALTISVEWTEE